MRLSFCYKILKRSSANRPNLIYSVRSKPDSKDDVVKDMVAFIRENHVGQSGIIYTFSKREADDVADGLCNNGIVARSYHSHVNDTQKDQVQRSWMRNETQVVVATIAFGLVSTALFGRSTELMIFLLPSKVLSLALIFIRESTNRM